MRSKTHPNLRGAKRHRSNTPKLVASHLGKTSHIGTNTLKSLVFFGGFPWHFQKDQGNEGRGLSLKVLGMMPKGPFRTKNTTALKSVVFCYGRSVLLSVPFSCRFFLEKQALLSTIRSVSAIAVAFFLAVVNLLSVLLLVRKGPLG